MTSDADSYIRVAVPREDGTGECYHAPGTPCSAHLTETVVRAVGDLAASDLRACASCVDYFGLEAIDA